MFATSKEIKGVASQLPESRLCYIDCKFCLEDAPINVLDLK